MARLKLKKHIKDKLYKLSVLTVLVLLGFIFIRNYNYRKTYEYKLLELNYPKDEIGIILNTFDNSFIDTLLSKEYNKNIINFINEKYFIKDNIQRYLDYQEMNPNNLYKDTVALVNVNRDYDYYENTRETDTSNELEMLVNKYNLLSNDYEVSNIVNVSSTYGYANNKLNEDAYNAFKRLADDARKEGHTIVILSSYRTHEYQEKLWNRDKDDDYVARPGASEHETGYAIDVAEYNDVNDSFKDTESYKWMIENSYKYGFILRYPEGKENITGYSYEAWHYRYLGVDLATKVFNEGITYDEYYAYYLDKE